jgi:hypothetical protein
MCFFNQNLPICFRMQTNSSINQEIDAFNHLTLPTLKYCGSSLVSAAAY